MGDSNSKTYRNRALWWHCHFWLCSCDPARWGGPAQDGPKPPRHRERFRLRDALPSVCRPPFAAPNSRSTPKFHHSLTFPLLLVNAGATLQHGRSSSGASSKVPSSFARRKCANQTACRSPTVWSFGIRRGRYIAFPPAYSQSRANATMESVITTPLFLITSMQPLCFHVIAHSFASALSCAFSLLGARKHANSFVCIGLEPLCRLFAPFSAHGSFVFNRLQPLFRKHPGWGCPTSLQDPASQRGRGAHIQLLLLQAQGFQVHGRSH